MIKKAFMVIFAVCALLFGVLSVSNPTDVFADGPGWIGEGTGNGGWKPTSPIDPTNTSECYRKDHYRALAYCAGLSWMYYEAVTPTTETIVFGPFGHVGVNDSGKRAEISGNCSNNGKGGFWHYGINVQGDNNGTPPSPIDQYGVSRYKLGSYSWGHWTSFTSKLAGSYTPHSVPGQNGYQAYNGDYYYYNYIEDYYRGHDWNWNIGKLSQVLYDTSNNPVYKTTGEYVTSTSDVYPYYKKACEKKYGVGDKRCAYVGEDVYAFCYWDEDFLGSSAASATNADDGTVIVEEITTGIVSQDSDAVVTSDAVEVGGTVNLVFKHNVYSEEPNKEIWWRTSETWLDTSNEKNTGKESGYRFESNVEPTVDKATFGNATIQDNGNTYYLPTTSPVITTTTPVTLLEGGTYVFCQDLKMADAEDKLKPGNVESVTRTSRACITIEVGVNYYGLSAAFAQSSMGISDSTSTEIVPMDSNVTASRDATVNIQFGAGLSNKTQTVKITFSHDIYADSEGGEVFWGIRRSSNSPMSFFPDSPMHFTTPQENGYYVNSSKVGGNYCEQNPTSDLCLSYTSLIATCRQNDYTDTQCANFIHMAGGDRILEEIQSLSSDDAGRYVIQNTVIITVSSKMDQRYCEKLYLGKEKKSAAEGNASFTSQACVRIIATETDDPPHDSAETYVKSRIKNSRISDEYIGIQNTFIEQPGNTVYAKPGDTIFWQDEYSPGAQRLSSQLVLTLNGDVVGTHGAEECGGGSAHTYKAMGKAGEWDNAVEIEAGYPLFESPDFGEWNRGEYHLKRESPVRFYKIRNTADATDVGKDGKKIVDVGKSYNDEIRTVGNTPQKAWFTSWGESFYAQCREQCGGVNNKHTCWPTRGPFYHSNYIIDGFYISATVSEGVEQLKSDTFLKIPFNYNNTLGFEISRTTEPNTTPVYPGETVQVINPFVEVQPKRNDIVGDTYATEVRDAKVKLIAYVSSTNQGRSEPWDVKTTEDNLCNIVADDVVYKLDVFCKEVNQNVTTTLEVKNDNGAEQQTSNGVTYTNTILGTQFNGTYSVFDARAGDWFCMTLGVYPATSGADDNLNTSGSESWRLYTPECIQIAKKPSFQVWGSGLYSAAPSTSITTNVSEKNNLFKVDKYPYSPRGGSVTIFGSWVEENVITVGRTQWLTSGASLGKSSNPNLKGGYGGAGVTSIDAEGVFCNNLIPLSFANYGFGGFSNFICPMINASGYAGIDVTAFDPSKTNAGALAEYWNDKDLPYMEDASESIALEAAGNPLLSATNKDIRSVKVEGDITIGRSQLTANQTRIVKAENVTIAGNIYYDKEGHDTLNDLSKVVIYASSSINILCDVNRVDAILLTAGAVNTCSDAGELVAENRSKQQLVINGTIIANEVKLERTYGNSMGISDGGYVSNKIEGDYYEKHTIPGSETPAEIINYDTSLLIWGASMAGAGESNTLTMTYQYELAPRY